jgi:hypothetical protein
MQRSETHSYAEATGKPQRQPPAVEHHLLTPQEYARVRRSSLRTLDRERAEGRGCPYVQLGARVFYRRQDIEKYFASRVRGGEFRVANEVVEHKPHRRGRLPKSA